MGTPPLSIFEGEERWEGFEWEWKLFLKRMLEKVSWTLSFEEGCKEVREAAWMLTGPGRLSTGMLSFH